VKTPQNSSEVLAQGIVVAQIKQRIAFLEELSREDRPEDKKVTTSHTGTVGGEPVVRDQKLDEIRESENPKPPSYNLVVNDNDDFDDVRLY
jgi:hypothetical protein